MRKLVANNPILIPCAQIYSTVELLYDGHFGNGKTVCYTEVSTIQRLFHTHTVYLDPPKTVLNMESYPLLGEIVIRSSTVNKQGLPKCLVM